MSYHLYHTPAFIIGAALRGEGSSTFTLLTKELGLISATAQSVREERSKLRYGLSNFSLSDVTLMRGKDSWRLTNASLQEYFYNTFRTSPEIIQLFGRVFRLLRRLVTGEEKNERLFTAVLEAVQFLKTASRPPQIWEDLKGQVEIVLVLRILHLLGYLAPRGEFGSVLSDVTLWNDSLLSEARGWKTLALSDINNSLRESQL